ncbi:DoxX family protein [Leptospira langatensis]|uniref:DoxX family protein n=1 Tax=Leptospira langatensis TaxID=2484983 RepID=A0A5F1ZN03_9LEPT|nr:DoxX family protein [Leptospira langatensis]TGK05218.1 DoxX family protein [Leptospira langatensis]TGL38354.1 DoxX family protein [Leptospira langatensis]
MEFLPLVGRILFAAIFVLAGPGHFSSERISHASDLGVPFAAILVPFSGVLAFVGGLSVILGYKAKLGALLLVLFLVPVTLMMHQFWGISDPVQVHVQRAMFIKNISLLGGAIWIVYFGSGPYSIRE